jgi:hypothetical protein
MGGFGPPFLFKPSTKSDAQFDAKLGPTPFVGPKFGTQLAAKFIMWLLVWYPIW